MVYIRGHAYDYDRWEKEGAKDWSYADCLPYFKKSQTHQLGKKPFDKVEICVLKFNRMTNKTII